MKIRHKVNPIAGISTTEIPIADFVKCQFDASAYDGGGAFWKQMITSEDQ